MNKVKYWIVTCLLLIMNLYAQAQCAMCKATVDSSLESGSTAAKGINNAVIYLFAMPIVAGILFYFIYRNRKKYLSKFSSEN